MDAEREKLLIRLLDELGLKGEDCQTIKNMQEKYDEAVATKNTISQENPELDKAVDAIDNLLRDSEGLKEAFIAISKDYTNVIEKLGIPYDFNEYVVSLKEAYEKKEAEKQAALDKKKLNEETLESLKDTIEFSPAEIQKAREHRAVLAEDITKVMSEGDTYLDGSREEPKLLALNVFSIEEIKKILPAICYPYDFGFAEIYSEYMNEKAHKTSVGKIINEAMNKSQEENSKPKAEEKKELKTESKEKKTTKEDKVDNELDDKLNNILKVTAMEFKPDEKVEKNEQQEEEKKEASVKQPKIAKNESEEEENKDAYLYNNFHITKLDSSFRPEVRKKSKEQLDEIYNKLKAADIDPTVVTAESLIKGDIDTLIANVKTLRENNLNIDDMTIAKGGIVTLAATPNQEFREKLKLISHSGLSLVKPTGKIAVDVMGRSADSLYKAENLVGETDITYFQERPERMAGKIADRMARIKFCQKNGIEYHENGQFAKFIEDDNEWNKMLEIAGIKTVVDSSSIPTVKGCNDALKQFISDDVAVALNNSKHLEDFISPIKISEDKKEQYQRIIELLSKVKENNGNDVIITINGHTLLTACVYKRLETILNSNVEDSDENILLAALLYNTHNTPETVMEIQKSLDPNTRLLKQQI